MYYSIACRTFVRRAGKLPGGNISSRCKPSMKNIATGDATYRYLLSLNDNLIRDEVGRIVSCLAGEMPVFRLLSSGITKVKQIALREFYIVTS